MFLYFWNLFLWISSTCFSHKGQENLKVPASLPSNLKCILSWALGVLTWNLETCLAFPTQHNACSSSRENSINSTIHRVPRTRLQGSMRHQLELSISFWRELWVLRLFVKYSHLCWWPSPACLQWGPRSWCLLSWEWRWSQVRLPGVGPRWPWRPVAANSVHEQWINKVSEKLRG